MRLCYKGLRALLGEKSFDDEMVRLYGLLPAEERKIVTSAAVHDYGGNVQYSNGRISG
ncbi:hypothetical protein NXW38_06035 [Bacteroides ovatus]|nr:hypothetical protein [Bacteroides ovatus]